MRPRYIQFHNIHDLDISGVHCIWNLIHHWNMLSPDLKLAHCCLKHILSETLGLKLIPGDDPIQHHHRRYMLSHKTEILCPQKNFPQSFRATITVNNSSAWIWRCHSMMNCGNSPWKKLSVHQPPQASVANTWSGSDQGESGIMDVPLYFSIKHLHHLRSARVSSGIKTDPFLGICLRRGNNCTVKTWPGHTHDATNWSLPNRDCRSVFEHLFFSHHSSNSDLISSILLWSMDKINSIELKRIPRNIMTHVGGTSLSTKVTRPLEQLRSFNTAWALWAFSHPKVIQIIYSTETLVFMHMSNEVSNFLTIKRCWAESHR